MRTNRTGILHILCVTVMLTAACSHRASYNSTIEQAEGMTDTDPHGALTLIYGRKDSLCAGAADSALYELVYTEAVHDLGVKLNDGRYISSSEQYFRLNGDRRRRARALVQAALCMYDNRNLHDAVMLMKKAEDVADGEDDSFLHFRIAAALAMMNRETGNRTLVMKYRRCELDAARRSGSERHMARAWNDMAAEYRRTGDTDSFMTCMNRCLPLTSKAAPEAQALIRTNMGCYHMNRGDTARAMQLFTMAYTASPDRLASLMLGDIYATRNDMDRAVAMWYDAADSYTATISKNALKRLIARSLADGDGKTQLFLSERLNSVYDGEISAGTASELVNLQKDYDSMRSERLHQERIMKMGGAAALLVIAMVWFVVYHRRRMSHYGRVINTQNRRLKEMNDGYTRDLEHYRELRLTLDGLQKEHEKYASLIEVKTRELEKMQAQLAEYQNDRRKPEQWNMEDRLINADCVYALHRMASAGRAAGKQDWDALHALINSHDSRLGELLASHSNLSPTEINVIILTRLRFIPTEIAVLTGMSSQSVTNTRARLLTKMFGVKGGAKDFDDRIRGI